MRGSERGIDIPTFPTVNLFQTHSATRLTFQSGKQTLFDFRLQHTLRSTDLTLSFIGNCTTGESNDNDDDVSTGDTGYYEHEHATTAYTDNRLCTD